ncbi:MAG: hypothetical protein DWQ34_23145 [Planctomycetota bacterium]|nr:MAG: hypothetical protein DWQ34_23145 [Planctomycetota bacterium]REK26090.1 MAG: hypothetical protein DWQ41_10565 [Planctomycetota bacterium]REK27078.1 MAG: hypothetical protein DWQ45_26480 [Planctomycetota bacterium]
MEARQSRSLSCLSSVSRKQRFTPDRARTVLGGIAVAVVLVFAANAEAGTHRTENFVVTAPSDEIAEQVGKAAEFYRRELAEAWLGETLPRWYRPCPIKVKVGQIGAGGATTFTFEGGEVFGWNMQVQGSLERILDSVIPHEVSHTIFASHFRCPLPRWADEGAATLVEHESERMRQVKLLDQVIQTNRRIPLPELLEISEYPSDMRDVLTLYAEGYSLADFLVQQHGREGRAVYLRFLADAMDKNWEYAFKKHYGFADVHAVEKKWTGWVLAGSPLLETSEAAQIAAARRRRESARDQQQLLAGNQAANPDTNPATVRGQSPRDLQPLRPIARQRRTRPPRQELSAPEPSVSARPEDPAAILSTGFDRQLRSPASPNNLPAEDSFPRQRGNGLPSRPDVRFDGAFSP